MKLKKLLSESMSGLPIMKVISNPFAKAFSVVNEAEDDKYVSIGFGRFKEKGKENNPDAPTFTKTDSGKYVPTQGGDSKPQDTKGGVNIFDKGYDAGGETPKTKNKKSSTDSSSNSKLPSKKDLETKIDSLIKSNDVEGLKKFMDGVVALKKRTGASETELRALNTSIETADRILSNPKSPKKWRKDVITSLKANTARVIDDLEKNGKNIDGKDSELEYLDSFELEDKIDSMNLPNEVKSKIDIQIKNLKNQEYELENAESDGDDEYAEEIQNDIDATRKEIDNLLKTSTQDKELPKSEPSQPKRQGNPQVNKAVEKKAEKLGITPQKLGKEEYQKKMAQAAVAALTDANFHSEARELISKLEGKPEWAEKPQSPSISSPEYDEWKKSSVYSSEYYDAQGEVEQLGVGAAEEAGWSGDDAADSIAHTLRKNGFNDLADKIQSVIKENKSTKLKTLIKK